MTTDEREDRWTHAICERCWVAREGGRPPVTVAGADCEECCFCGASTRGGIFVRAHPMTALCGGKHSGDQAGALAVVEVACPACSQIGGGFGPSHEGSPLCRCGSLAAGGSRAHCTCDTCF